MPMQAPEALKAWREAQIPSLSQAAAGKRIGVTAPTWCDWEQGKKSPTVDRAEDIEKLTGGAVTVPMWAEFTRDRRAERAAPATPESDPAKGAA
jgi:transcriptional regulator with XRE-family HTH domain